MWVQRRVFSLSGSTNDINFFSCLFLSLSLSWFLAWGLGFCRGTGDGRGRNPTQFGAARSSSVVGEEPSLARHARTPRRMRSRTWGMARRAHGGGALWGGVWSCASPRASPAQFPCGASTWCSGRGRHRGRCGSTQRWRRCSSATASGRVNRRHAATGE